MAVGVSRFVRVRFRSEVISNLDVEIKSLNPKFIVVISRARLKLPPPFDKWDVLARDEMASAIKRSS